jgi:hypothetical protein
MTDVARYPEQACSSETTVLQSVAGDFASRKEVMARGRQARQGEILRES